ncbi:MAG: elongation factor G [Candidatus Brocadiia bacterium]
MDLHRLRNIGIAAHIDAGKTTVTERMLYYTGRLHRMGSVDEGTATMDWKPQEQERGITIVSAATSCYWQNRDDRANGSRDKKYQINIIDTPGHVDFTAEVERCMRVLDGVVAVFCGVGGVEAQSETVWHQAERYDIPRVCFVNKLDRQGSNMMRVVEEIRERLGAHPVPVQIPFRSKSEFLGVVDLIQREVWVYEEDSLGATYDVREIPERYRDETEVLREEIIETVAENVDWAADKYIVEETLTEDEIRTGLREACIAGDLQPVLCGAALRNRGVQPLLDAVCDYLPSPLETKAIPGKNPKTGEKEERHAESDDPFSALMFKIQSERHGDLFFIRVYSGHLDAKSRVYNANQKKTERVTQLYRMHADKHEQIEKAEPGSIVAAKGLKKSVTGDTLCDKKHPVVFERMSFPNTVVSMAIEPKTQAEQDKLDQALDALAREDPTFRARVSAQTGQLLVSGMGELHLEIIRDRLLREYNVDANVGEPRVSYRESLKEPVTVVAKFEKEAEGRGQYAWVKMRFEPDVVPEGIEFENAVDRDVLANHFVRAIERSLQEGSTGPLYGYPLINVKAVLLGAKTHPVDSTELAFEAAAGLALRNAMDEGKAQLLEPVMRLEIVVPEQYLGDVIGQITSCRGEIKEVETRDQLRVLRAHAPLAELFGFASDLRSMTQGRGTYSMEPFEYQPAPPDVLDFGM